MFGWEVEPRPDDVFHRIVPGRNFQLDDGTHGPTGNLHMGIFDAANARPHPDPAGVEPRDVSRDGHTARTWILVSDDDSIERILDEAELARRRRCCGATTTGPSSTASTPPSSTRGATRSSCGCKGGDAPEIPEGSDP